MNSPEQQQPDSQPPDGRGFSLQFVSKHRSIDSLQAVHLPDLTVLCGINGSGKTHLLKAILEGKIAISAEGGAVHVDAIKFLDWSTMVPNNSQQVNSGNLWRNRTTAWEQIEAGLFNNANFVNSLRSQLRAAVGDDRFGDTTGNELWSVDRAGLQLETPQQKGSFENYMKQRDQFRTQAVSSGPAVQHKYLIEISERDCGKPIYLMTKGEFEAHSPLVSTATDPFQQSLTEIFVAYARTWVENRLRQAEFADGKPAVFLSDEQFAAKHGPRPWDFLNELLEAGGYYFRANEPSLYKPDQDFRAVLVHQVNGAEIDFEHLSSGEKILVSLAIMVFNTEDGRPIIEYPRVILLDEIDSPLHPSMIRSVLDIIQEYLISRHRISVIMTTHSPSTVAITPEASLYEMRSEEPRVQKIGQTEALRLLTAGVPTLTVKSQNRRQVFVESHHDVHAYESLHRALARHLQASPIGLDFIASSQSKANQGNRDAVIEMVERLEESGLETAYGIADWDVKELPVGTTGRVMSPGGEHRYSIENFLLDPVLVAALLIRERMHHDLSREDLLGLGAPIGPFGGLDSNEADSQYLQQVADQMLDRIAPRVPSPTGSVEVETAAGHALTYPAWFMQYKGHELLKLYRQAIPQIGKRWAGDVEMSREILDLVVADAPQLVDRALLDLLDCLASDDPALYSASARSAA